MNKEIIIISGGQTGADRGALDAALEAGVLCAGWCPEGRLAEDGVISSRYPLQELSGGNYVQRTRRNVEDSDATTVIYFKYLEGGSELTAQFCHQTPKPLLLLDAHAQLFVDAVGNLLEFTRRYRPRLLNVAGPRASKQADAYAYTKALVAHYLENL